MKIRRSSPISEFVILPNATVRDDRLSYLARGILAEILSRPDGWETSADALHRRAAEARPNGKHGEGRRAIRAAVAELEACGYVVRTRAQDDRGRWSTHLAVHDRPAGRTDVPLSDRRKTGTSETGTSLGRRSTKTDPPPSPSRPSLSLACPPVEDGQDAYGAQWPAPCAADNARAGEGREERESGCAEDGRDGGDGAGESPGQAAVVEIMRRLRQRRERAEREGRTSPGSSPGIRPSYPGRQTGHGTGGDAA